MTTPTHLPTGPDEDPRLTSGPCRCGQQWLPSWVLGLFTVDGEHARAWCRSIGPP